MKNNLPSVPEKFYLGKLCKRGHDYKGTGLSLKPINGRSCVICLNESAKAYKEKCQKAHLIGDGSAIDTDAYIPETEKVKCSEKEGELIERQECLDYSGQEKHHDKCINCDHFGPTRNLILGKRPVE